MIKTTSVLVCLFVALSMQITAQDIVAKNADLKVISSAFKFTEGPAVDKQGNVFFTDQPNNQILKWSVDTDSITTYLKPSGRANGLYFDHDGNLLACADEKFQLWQIDGDKKINILIDDFEGKKLNGPNDLWVDAKGGIYFTDPYYQRPYWKRQQKEIKEERVYYLSPDLKTIKVVATDFVRPNGIIGSADGKTLYISDNGDKKTFSFTINEDASLTNRKLFIKMGSDGMTIDNQGNLYLTGNGVTVFNKNGEQIKHIPIPQSWTANVTFGGKDQKTLFITAMNSVYTLKMNVKGIR